MTLHVERTAPTAITLTRSFDAPPEAIWAAHTDPTLIRRWMCGGGGTVLEVHEMESCPSGALRMEWRETDGSGFSVEGTFETVEPPAPGRAGRTVHTETMLLPEPMPVNRIETRFEPEGTGTRLVVIMTLPEAADADALLASGMTDGMEGCYALLDRLEVPEAA